MAIVSGFDGLLYSDDNHFTEFLDGNEDVILQILDALHAEELQFQEALQASLITAQITNNVLLSPPPMEVSAIAEPGLEPSVIVNETGESSLSLCEICNQRKENDQMFRNESCVHSFCLDCISKHVLAMIQDGKNIVTCPGSNCKCVLELDICSKELHTETSSQKGSGEPFTAGTSNNPTSKGGNVVEVSSPIVKPASDSVADISLSPAQDDGKWEVSARKSNIREESSAAKYGNTGPRNTSNSKKPVSKRYRPRFLNNYMAPKPVNCPPLERGQSITDFTPSKGPEDGQEQVEDYIEVINNKSAAAPAAVFDDDDNSDGLNQTDGELLSDGFDSDTSQKSHETRKNNRWFKEFFDSLNNLTIEEINEPTRQWHCPACQGGAGAIRWYKGFQPLITHCNTQGKKRMKLHQELAELLDEELRRKRTPVTPASEVLAKWKALRDEEKDHEIVWPPMVVIMNTGLKQDVNGKWTGMGNQKLLDYFSSNSPVKAQHSYGPQGHRGMSVLIFESSARGFLEAECLHVHFAKEGRGRNAWNHSPVYFLPDGERQLYGYMAMKEDLDIFNQHFKGNSKLKYEMRSYEEMVLNQVKQMSEDNKQLIGLKNRFAQEQGRVDALQESLLIESEKLQMRTEEIRIVKQRTKLLHEKNKEEVDSLEQFFQDQFEIIVEARNAKEEILQPEQNDGCREEKIAKSINFQEMEDLEAKRCKLIEVVVDKMVAIKKRHKEEDIMLETDFDF